MIKFQVNDNKKTTTPEIDADMQELVQLVLKKSDGLNSDLKHIFFAVARSLYYPAVCDVGTINYHMVKVLFERVY